MLVDHDFSGASTPGRETPSFVRPACAAAPAPRRSIRRDAPPLLKATDDVLMLRLAEELEYVRRALDSMGDALSVEPILIARHAMSLQSFDVIGQLLGHLVTVVRSSDRAEAVNRIGMAELKARLTRGTIA